MAAIFRFTIQTILLFTLCLSGIRAQVPNCVKCCCGNINEVGIPCGNFQEPPFADQTGWIDYSAGQEYCGWTVTAGTISIHGPYHNNLGAGNPNGASQHMDLNGSTNGTVSTNLTGMTPGYKYTIVLWYAKHNATSVANATIKVAGGTWLNESWSSTNTGSNVWLEKCFSFVAQASTATLEFEGTSPVPCCGMLIDDLTMYECSNDDEVPVFSDIPDALIEVECPSEIPPAPILTATDNRDAQPTLNYSESQQGTPCKLTITRTWTVSDACDNSATLQQIVNVEDKEAPQFTTLPQDKTVNCDDDLYNEFYNWLGNNGGADASDNCTAINWSKTFNKEPDEACEEIFVTFTIKDLCDNETQAIAKFIVTDTDPPYFTKNPQNTILSCEPDALNQFQNWLANNGFATATDKCGQVIWSNDFDGDFNKTKFDISFTAKDLCGNEITKSATFEINENSKTTLLFKTTCDKSMSGKRDTVVFSNGSCDSLVITESVFAKSDTSYITGMTCKLSEAVNDTLFLSNQNGCDSLIITSIIYNKPDTTYSIFNICGLQNEYNDTLHFAGQFCDSTVILQYKSLPVNVISINNSTCDPSKAGTEVLTLKNQFGCDSIVTITTILSEAIYTYLTKHSCGTGPVFKDTVIYVTAQCDSLVITEHILHPPDATFSSATSCDKKQAGVFTTTFKNIWGCDSVHVLTVNLNPSDTVYITGTTCDKSKEGNFTENLKNQFGCDSIIYRTITYIPSDTTYITELTCDPTQTGTFVNIYPTQQCDSVVIITRNLTQSYIQYFTATTCNSAMAGIDTLKYLSKQGCDSLIITETIFKGFSASVLTVNESCLGFGDGALTIEGLVNAITPVQYSLDKVNWVNDSIFTSLTPGEYTVYIKDAVGCELELTGNKIKAGDTFTIDLGPDITVTSGKRAFLDLSTSSVPASIVWSLDTLNNCIICTKVDFKPSQSTTLFATATSQSGCVAVDSIHIILLPDIKIYAPNAFSPEVNGINDKWIIYGDQHLANIKELHIYDRWGEQVFYGENIQPGDSTRGWDGKHRGEFMKPAVFVFWAIVEFDDGRPELIKGDINLVR